MEGWLEKRGEVNQSWRRRWFTLTKTTLEYRKSETDRKPRGCIDGIQSCAFAIEEPQVAEKGDKLWMIVAVSASQGRTFYLRGSEKEVQRWYQALRPIKFSFVGGEDDDPGDAPLGEEDSYAAVAAVSTRSGVCLKQGWMEKLGAKRKAWRRRFFRLFHEKIEYYEKEEAGSARGAIDLRGAKASVLDGDRPGEGQLRIHDTRQDRVYLIRAPSAEAKAWLEAINARPKGRSGARPKQSRGKALEAARAKMQAQAQKEREAAAVALEAEERSLEEIGSGAAGGPAAGAEQLQVQKLALTDEDRDEIIAIRDDAIQAITEDMTEINGMFREVQSLVVTQGSMLDSLEANMSDVSDRVETGTAHLQKAKQRQGWF